MTSPVTPAASSLYRSLACQTRSNALQMSQKMALASFQESNALIIACPLTHVINLSLVQGVVPDDFKSARVVPLCKKSDKARVGNYRPVSILMIISKVFERVVYDQVESYLEQKKPLYIQSGFRSR